MLFTCLFCVRLVGSQSSCTTKGNLHQQAKGNHPYLPFARRQKRFTRLPRLVLFGCLVSGFHMLHRLFFASPKRACWLRAMVCLLTLRNMAWQTTQGSISTLPIDTTSLQDRDSITTAVHKYNQQQDQAQYKLICDQATTSSYGLNQGGGLHFLVQKGIVPALGLVPHNDSGLVVQAGQTVQIPLLQCGNCTADADCVRAVSFAANLIGNDALLSANVVVAPTSLSPTPSLHQTRDNDSPPSPLVFGMVEFTAPSVTGTFQLHVKARWWNGMEEPHSNGTTMHHNATF